MGDEARMEEEREKERMVIVQVAGKKEVRDRTIRKTRTA